MIFCFRGYWNGNPGYRHLSAHPADDACRQRAASLVLILLGLPAMGAAGAGAGTTLSLYAGVGHLGLVSARHARRCFDTLPQRFTVVTTLRLATPQLLPAAAAAGAVLFDPRQVDTASAAGQPCW
ncbi:hypothetical protein DSL92_00195 [Billgrantia gudaonensis]|uniref:Uncharacterized protein n=1 Tax=Billgrantia gudaonensis TaxID=376427 RepID=A0A432JKW9_9GAMM|nr:hypothetical protein DSL92_00195 [Halomonas gudaonensis]